MTEANFNKLTAKQILHIFREQHIVVTEMSTPALKFDGKGLSTLTSLSAVTDIQGMLFFLLQYAIAFL
jgi:hypothetical protein